MFFKERIKKYTFLFLFIFGFVGLSSAEPILPKKRNTDPRFRLRLTVAPVVSIYKVNKNHASNPKQKMSGYVSLREEIRLNRSHTGFLLIGLEYLVHGVNFNSYYFKPDSIQLYDGNMDAKYALNIHEIDVPVQIKYSFTRENNSLFSPYIMFGYHFRTLLFGVLTVQENGQQVKVKKEELTFKTPLFTPKNNPFVSITAGFQRNWPNSTRNCLYAELSYRLGFSPYLLSDTFTPSSLYIRGSHFALGLGVKF
jgi:hypothetical protein